MLNAKARLDKRLINLDKELKTLYRKPDICVALPEPIQRGWRRHQILTERAQELADHKVLQEMLLSLGNVQYSRTRDFLEWKFVGRRMKKVKIEQKIDTIMQGQWDRLKWPAAWKAYFRCVARFPDRPWLDRFEFRRPWYFALKVVPYMVDTVFVCDSTVDRRISEIESWIRHHGLMYRWQRIRDESVWKVPNTKWKALEELAQTEIRDSKNESHEADVKVLQRHIHTSLRALVLPPA